MSKTMLATFAAAMTMAGTALAGEPASVQPMAAFVQDIGGKQVVGYYVAASDACQITMMVAESPATAMAIPSAARVRFALPPAATASVESAEGGKLDVTCGSGATALIVNSHPATPRLASN